MDHEGGPVIVEDVNDLDRSSALTAANDKQLSRTATARIPAAGLPHHGLDLRNRATVPGCVLLVPLHPSKLHDVYYIRFEQRCKRMIAQHWERDMSEYVRKGSFSAAVQEVVAAPGTPHGITCVF
jgi:hypothetical protein